MSFYGSTTAQRLAEYDIFDEVVLADIVEGKPEDWPSAAAWQPVAAGRRRFGDQGHRADHRYPPSRELRGSHRRIRHRRHHERGLPRKPGMSRMDLIGVNAKIVKET